MSTHVLAGLFALSLCAPLRAQTSAPTLLASYNSGEDLAFTLSNDRTLGFLAEGSTIRILDMNGGGTPTTIGSPVPIEFATPSAVLLDGTQLFVAGGSSGLFRIGLCSTLFSAHTACSSYAVDALFDDGDLVCIDMARVTLDSTDCLAVLFAGVPESRVRFFDLSTGGALQCDSVHDCYVALDQPDSPAYALAADPGDPDLLYVAAGKRGVLRIRLTGLDHEGSAGAIEAGPVYACNGGPQRVRDVAVVRPEGRDDSLLYVALDQGNCDTSAGECEEIDLADGWSSSTLSTSMRLPPATGTCRAYAHDIAAVSDSSGNVLIAIGTNQNLSATAADHAGPFAPNGRYQWDLTLGIVDPYVGSGPGCDPQVVYFGRGHGDTSPTRLSTLGVSGFWRGLALVPDGGTSFLAGECTSQGLIMRALSWSGSSFSQTSTTFHTPYYALVDMLVSKLNPNLVFGSFDGGTAPPTAFLIDGVPGSSIAPLANSGPIASAACATLCGSADVYDCGIFGGVSWLDDGSPTTREWFLSPRSQTLIPTDDDCLETSCPSPTSLGWRAATSSEPNLVKGGYLFSSLEPAYPSAGAPDPTQWSHEWYQLVHRSGQPKISKNDYGAAVLDPRLDPEDGAPVLIAGIRGINAVMGCVLLDRKKTLEALRTCSDPRGAYFLPTMAGNDTTVTDANANALTVGTDMTLPGGSGELVIGRELRTHFEFGEQCIFRADSTHPTVNFNARSFRGDIWRPTYSGQTKTLLVVAAGYAGNDRTDACSSPSCNAADSSAACSASGQAKVCCEAAIGDCSRCDSSCWSHWFGSPMLVIYDLSAAVVPDSGGGSPTVDLAQATLKRLALDDPWQGTSCTETGADYYAPGNPRGAAMAVKVQRVVNAQGVGKYWAFVADLGGKLRAYDVSVSKIFASGLSEAETIAPDHALLPASTLDFGLNPFDGNSDNCLDMELDGYRLYIALGRGGVAVVDISDPTNMVVEHILDVPGICEGLTIRTTADGDKTLLVSCFAGGLFLFDI